MRNTHINKLAAGLVVLVGFVSQVGAAGAQQPAISSISGSTTQGAMLTISGSSLNAETRQGWDGFFLNHPDAWSFEGSTPQNDGFSLIGPAGTQYDTSVKLLGNRSAKYSLQGASSNCPIGNLTDYDGFSLATPTNDLYMRLYARWRATEWPYGYVKMFNTVTAANYYIQPANASSYPGTTFPTQFEAIYDAVNHYATIPSGRLQNDRWYLIEAHIKNSSPTVFTMWIDGTQVMNRTDMQTGSAINVWLFGLVNLCYTSSNFSMQHWIDGMVVGSSRIYPAAIVEVGDSSNYTTANKKVQALEKIADDEIIFKLDTSGLGSGPYYVWVRNNAQQLSPAYFLTGGQVSGPAAPSNLRIVP